LEPDELARPDDSRFTTQPTTTGYRLPSGASMNYPSADPAVELLIPGVIKDQPRRARPSLIALPKPLEAPVTIAVLMASPPNDPCRAASAASQAEGSPDLRRLRCAWRLAD
jgi:hypothetical protein